MSFEPKGRIVVGFEVKTEDLSPLLRHLGLSEEGSANQKRNRLVGADVLHDCNIVGKALTDYFSSGERLDRTDSGDPHLLHPAVWPTLFIDSWGEVRKYADVLGIQDPDIGVFCVMEDL